jgi:hypothetical protein
MDAPDLALNFVFIPALFVEIERGKRRYEKQVSIFFVEKSLKAYRFSIFEKRKTEP